MEFDERGVSLGGGPMASRAFAQVCECAAAMAAAACGVAVHCAGGGAALLCGALSDVYADRHPGCYSAMSHDEDSYENGYGCDES